jgi:hypothetical protein
LVRALVTPGVLHVPALSLCPADPTCQLVPNLSPTSLVVDAPASERSPTTSACPRPFRPRAPLAHFPPAHLHPQPSSLALRAQPYKLHRRSPKTAAVSQPLLSPRRALFLGKLRRITHSSGHPSVHSFPLWFARSVLTRALLT